MESQLNINDNRDGETPRALSGNSFPDAAESYPVSSGSVQSFRRSSRLAGRQAGAVKNATAKGLKGSVFVSESNLISQLERPSHSRKRSKTIFEDLQQEQHHSSVSHGNGESFSDDFASSFKPTYQHNLRDSNLRKDVNFERKTKIIFPSANDSRWNEWNGELDSLLSKQFGFRMIRSLSSTELSEKFDNFLYDFFKEKLGNDAFVKQSTEKQPKKFENKKMKRLRAKKKKCKKAFKVLVRAGLGDSEEAGVLKKRWLSLVRQHNKLRVSLEFQRKQRAKSAAEKRFKKNPFGYAQSLFEGMKKNASPTFSKEDCEDYFSNLYRDVGRDHVYDFLPELKRPLNPAASSLSFKFSFSGAPLCSSSSESEDTAYHSLSVSKEVGGHVEKSTILHFSLVRRSSNLFKRLTSFLAFVFIILARPFVLKLPTIKYFSLASEPSLYL
mmetsp:Transcript_17792/g.23055  ORF Transcript_17792/g.23055 Transcript_17792/m.23055 type:complete len:441 (-) Transcript_17792:28-1350(-)